MKLYILKIGVLFIFLVGLFSGCSVKKYIQEDEYLVNKYKVQVENRPEKIEVSDLRSFLKPKRNSSFLGIRWKLHNYYKYKEKPTKFNKWMEKNFSEYPSMYSEDNTVKVGHKMEKYLNNVGFFNSKVTHSLDFTERSVNITYHIKPATPYRISEISYDVSDSLLNTFFEVNLNKTLIKEGDIYNAYIFDNERDRITTHLRDEGYYYFNRNFIQFTVDTAFANHSMSVVLKINKVKEPVKGVPGQFTESNHRRFFIKNIDVIPDWKPLNEDVVYDTVRHQIRFWNDPSENYYNFLSSGKERIKPQAFNSSIKIKPEHAYSSTEVQQTYRSLFNFRIIRTATILFDTTGAGNSEDGSYSYMNSRIQMQTSKLNSFQAELEGTSSSGDLGIRGNIVIANKNIFKRADVFSIRINGGLEAQSVGSSTSGATYFNTFFNTFEAGINGNFYFPRFLFPGRLIRFNQRYSPTTNINFGYSFQKRPDYDRYITNIDFGYQWDHTKQIKHILTPINLNYVNIYPSDTLRYDIENNFTPSQKEQFSDHFIAGLSYSFIFNNQNLKILEHFNYFRANIETSGNLLSTFNWALPQDTNGFYTVFDVPYSQYVRFSFDFRHYYYFSDKTNGLVFRILLGYGLPYLNSSEMPYEKSFFAGGANDMRGWQFRTLGPGGYGGDVNYERAGSIQIEGNIEYRFPVYNVLKGALFVDVGNIWTRNDESYKDGTFKWGIWQQQLAVDAGIGVRLDFSFFIFRLDMAIPIVDPAYWGELTEGQLKEQADGKNVNQFRYPIEWWRTVFNFGIGYPF